MDRRVEIAGRALRMNYTVNALCAVEARAGGSLDALMERQFSAARLLLWGALTERQPEMTLEEAGEPAQWVAFVERGCFKYLVHNDEEGKDYCTGFAFEGEFVADFPYCLDGDVSEVSIEADMPCEVRIISGRELQALFDSDPKMMLHNVRILKNLFKMVYGRDLDHYRYTARSRYRRLIDRCPQVVQMLSLKDIASFLNITPSYLSTLRKEMTYETRAEGKRACTMPRKKE